jgi:hypothetical protein
MRPKPSPRKLDCRELHDAAEAEPEKIGLSGASRFNGLALGISRIIAVEWDPKRMDARLDRGEGAEHDELPA